MKYEPTIGLEIHAELKTKTKMFCDSLNDPDERHPNVSICPVCTGQPGTLPVINKAAVEAVLKVGMALNGDIPQFSKFDRKNYFYPDLPKGYQISQYDLPLIFGGILNGVRLRRIHLEEDTGRLIHEARSMNYELREEKNKIHDSKFMLPNSSLVDFNRAGVPLMELVTEPDIKSAGQAVEFARELQLILRYLDVSDADMEKGQMRVEANISLCEIADQRGHKESRINAPLGTKVEVKNINSFKAVHDAIEYEIKRQSEHLNEGKKVIQETRGWDDNKKATVSQRLKEEAHDYRYFPEPDLPPLDLSKFDLASIKTAIPELPKEKRLRFIKEYSLTPEQAELLVAERATAQYFEEAVSELTADLRGFDPSARAQLDAGRDADQSVKESATKLIFNYLTTDLRGLMAENEIAMDELKINPEDFADLVELVYAKEISSRGAKEILKKMLETGLDPREVLKQHDLRQVSDESELKTVAEKVLASNPAAVADYRKGKQNVLQFLVGEAMAELKGKGNPGVLQKILKELIMKAVN